MTDIVVRGATPADLPHILRHRRSMFEAMGERDNAKLDAMESESEGYFRSALEDGTYRCWLAETTSGEVVAGGGIVISPWPAMPRTPQPRRATILNMYTDPAFRRQGIARRLMTAMLDWLRQEHFFEVSLHASDFWPLYEQLGFRPTNEMRLTLQHPGHETSGTCCSGSTEQPSGQTVSSPRPKDLTIRQASKSDAENIRQCLSAAFELYRSEYSRGGFFDTVPSVANLTRRLVDMTLFVAESEGRVIGTIGCNKTNDQEGHLRGMAVLPEWQGSGVAAKLLVRAETELKRRGCIRVTLDTTEPLQRAMRFYEKRGFRPSGRVSDFFGMRLHEYVKQL